MLWEKVKGSSGIWFGEKRLYVGIGMVVSEKGGDLFSSKVRIELRLVGGSCREEFFNRIIV